MILYKKRERERGGGGGREQTHLITSSFDILSLSQRKPATPNRRYRDDGLEVGVVKGRGFRVLLTYRKRIGNSLHTLSNMRLLNFTFISTGGGGGGGGGVGGGGREERLGNYKG